MLPICEGQPAGTPEAFDPIGSARIKRQGLRQRWRVARIDEGISLDSLFMIEGSQRARQRLAHPFQGLNPGGQGSSPYEDKRQGLSRAGKGMRQVAAAFERQWFDQGCQ